MARLRSKQVGCMQAVARQSVQTGDHEGAHSRAARVETKAVSSLPVADAPPENITSLGTVDLLNMTPFGRSHEGGLSVGICCVDVRTRSRSAVVRARAGRRGPPLPPQLSAALFRERSKHSRLRPGSKVLERCPWRPGPMVRGKRTS